MNRDLQMSQHLFAKEQGWGSIPLVEDSHGSSHLGSAMKLGQDGDLGAHTYLSRAGSASKGAANLTKALLILKPWQ